MALTVWQGDHFICHIKVPRNPTFLLSNCIVMTIMKKRLGLVPFNIDMTKHMLDFWSKES